MACVLKRSAGVLATIMLLIATPGAFVAPSCANLPQTDLKLQLLSADDIQEEVAPATEIARLSTAIRGDVGSVESGKYQIRRSFLARKKIPK